MKPALGLAPGLAAVTNSRASLRVHFCGAKINQRTAATSRYVDVPRAKMETVVDAFGKGFGDRSAFAKHATILDLRESPLTK